MSYLKERFSEYSSEYLLEQRALGDELSDEAHAAIEAVFRERNEHLPPRPLRPVEVQSETAAKQEAWGKAGAGALVLFAGAVAAKLVVNSWLLFPVAVGYATYYLFKHLRRANLSEEERAAEDFDAAASERGMTGLMKCAAENDTGRAQDLLNYGAPVNETDSAGATALMYAARNGAREMTELLLAAGADRNMRTRQGSSAKDIAARHGHAEVAALL